MKASPLSMKAATCWVSALWIKKSSASARCRRGKEIRRLMMKEQFTTTVRVKARATPARAFADALNHVQSAVMRESPYILLRIEPQDVRIVQAHESVRKEAFLFFFAPGTTHLQRGAGCDRQRDRHQSRQGGFRRETLILLKGIVMFLIILIKSLIIGALVGVGWALGCTHVSRANHAGDGRVPYVGRTQLL